MQPRTIKIKYLLTEEKKISRPKNATTNKQHLGFQFYGFIQNMIFYYLPILIFTFLFFVGKSIFALFIIF